MPPPFDVATGVQHVAEGRWRASMDADWFAPTGRSLTSLSARLEQDVRLCALALARPL